MRLYLAGAMSGVTWEEATGWRDNVISHYITKSNEGELNVDLEIFNPCSYVVDGEVSSEREDMDFDLYKLRRSDFVICNWNGDSIGTAIEIGVAKEHNIPIVVYTEDVDRLSKMHPWVKHSAIKVFDNLEDLLVYVDKYFL